jgi:hypothetical protein
VLASGGGLDGCLCMNYAGVVSKVKLPVATHATPCRDMSASPSKPRVRPAALGPLATLSPPDSPALRQFVDHREQRFVAGRVWSPRAADGRRT